MQNNLHGLDQGVRVFLAGELMYAYRRHADFLR